jgi:hypothetical protein
VPGGLAGGSRSIRYPLIRPEERFCPLPPGPPGRVAIKLYAVYLYIIDLINKIFPKICTFKLIGNYMDIIQNLYEIKKMFIPGIIPLDYPLPYKTHRYSSFFPFLN